MQFKRLLNDDDAVSPVIGVILMVAITVILAAVIGTFVLGLGEQVQETAPNTNMDFEYNGAETLEITQTGGQGIDYTALGISVDGTIYHHASSNEFDDQGTTDDIWFATSGKTSAGDNVVLTDSTNTTSELSVNGGSGVDSTVDEVRVVWRSGDSSSTVQTWENN